MCLRCTFLCLFLPRDSRMTWMAIRSASRRKSHLFFHPRFYCTRGGQTVSVEIKDNLGRLSPVERGWRERRWCVKPQIRGFILPFVSFSLFKDEWVDRRNIAGVVTVMVCGTLHVQTETKTPSNPFHVPLSLMDRLQLLSLSLCWKTDTKKFAPCSVYGAVHLSTTADPLPLTISDHRKTVIRILHVLIDTIPHKHLLKSLEQTLFTHKEKHSASLALFFL